MNAMPDKPRFNLSLSKFAFVNFITPFLIGVIWIEINHVAFSQTIESIKPLPTPFNILIDLPTWAKYGVYIIYCLVQALIATSCLWLIRCMLPEKYKACLPWRKLKDA